MMNPSPLIRRGRRRRGALGAATAAILQLMQPHSWNNSDKLS
jgi:hypothetical protein